MKALAGETASRERARSEATDRHAADMGFIIIVMLDERDGLIVAGEARQLPGSGEEACVQIKGDDAQLAVFDAAVGAFGGRDPGGGKMI